VLIEVVATVIEVVEEHHAGNKIKVHHILTFIGAGLIALAVGWEGLAEYRSAETETKLRDNNANTQRILADTARKATADAVELTDKFGGLHDFVATQERSIDAAKVELERGTASLNKARDEALSAANATKGDLEKVTALLNQEKDVHEKVQALTTPRTLKAARQQLVTAFAKPFAGQRYRVAISGSADDGLPFWQSLYPALKNAGWVYIPAGPPSIGDPPAGIPLITIPGIEIRFDPSKEQQLTPAALALGTALHMDGTVVAVNRNRQADPDEAARDVLLIFIGARVVPQ